MSNQSSGIQNIFLVAFTCVLLGGTIGAVTNMINGSVSPYYFRTTMNWDFQDIWIATVAQGILEGLMHGIFFALIFTTGFGLITKGKANYQFALKHILRIAIIVMICWFIGGLLAMMLVNLSPDFYRSHFPWTPTQTIEQLKFAWVGGSIWGEILGSFLSAILGLVAVKNSWLEYINPSN